MRTRLQMTREEARASREQMISDMHDLAVFLGAPICDMGSINAALKAKYGASFYAKEGIVPRTEYWNLRFMRGNGLWLTTAERTRPERTTRLPGPRIPRYVRLRVPIRKDGTVPASLAPRREDLPRLVKGTWKYVRTTRGGAAPEVTVEVDAPRYSVVIQAMSTGLAPVIVRFPAQKKRLGAEIAALAEKCKDVKRAQLARARAIGGTDGRQESAPPADAAA